jgi:hypothetical protein
MPVHHRDTGSVVTLSNEDHPALASVLERELVKERETQIQGLVSAKDWPDFQKRKGMVDGLNAAISICVEVRKRLEA